MIQIELSMGLALGRLMHLFILRLGDFNVSFLPPVLEKVFLSFALEFLLGFDFILLF